MSQAIGWLVQEGRTDVRKRAFTLIELLVVIAMMALLIGMLLPAMRLVRERGKAVVCTTNLKQLISSAHLYAGDNDDYYPLAYIQRSSSDGTVSYDCWDFITVTSQAETPSVRPGLLWQGDVSPKIQQCPSYSGSANWQSNPYTGYNYNASYIGGSVCSVDGTLVAETLARSARVCDIKNSSQTAVFGDGEYGSGANKFMRSPLRGALDKSFSARSAGSQGFRHNGRTNFAVADGSVQTSSEPVKKVGNQACADGTGFLSADNSAYDLK
jgi:prepilin-type N-terminal cleavage/methylation domain-containing protein/prepilin-type processing-associated H-X9-DG protein